MSKVVPGLGPKLFFLSGPEPGPGPKFFLTRTSTKIFSEQDQDKNVFLDRDRNRNIFDCSPHPKFVSDGTGTKNDWSRSCLT